MKNIAILLLLLTNTLVFSQKKPNAFAYVVVPEHFSFLNGPDQYQLNSLTKFLLEKKGFVVFSEYDPIPKKLAVLDCGGLFFKLKKKSNLFQTRLQFELFDCHRKIVFESSVGVSREKQYRKAYQESLRKAFESLSKKSSKVVPLAEEYTETIPLDTKLEKRERKSQSVYINSEGLRIQLVENKGSYVGNLVLDSTDKGVSGALICRLLKTSLPHVFKVFWHEFSGKVVQTIGYFDDKGNLNIDFETEQGLSVMVFEPMN